MVTFLHDMDDVIVTFNVKVCVCLFTVCYLVSRAFRVLLRGCCSRQLTAGFPATGRVMALSTRDVMACTASTLI